MDFEFWIAGRERKNVREAAESTRRRRVQLRQRSVGLRKKRVSRSRCRSWENIPGNQLLNVCLFSSYSANLVYGMNVKENDNYEELYTKLVKLLFLNFFLYLHLFILTFSYSLFPPVVHSLLQLLPPSSIHSYIWMLHSLIHFSSVFINSCFPRSFVLTLILTFITFDNESFKSSLYQL